CPGRALAEQQARQPLASRTAQDGRPPPPTPELSVPHRARSLFEAHCRTGFATLGDIRPNGPTSTSVWWATWFEVPSLFCLGICQKERSFANVPDASPN